MRSAAGAAWTTPEIVRLELATGVITPVGRADFVVARGLHLDLPGYALYMLGLETSDSRTDALKGDPFLARLSLATGQFSRVALPGMLAGQVPPGHANGDSGTYRPALALAPDGKRAYVVDSASDRIVSIDLASMTISDDRSLAKPRPAWKRGLSWLGGQVVSTAHAKGSEYHTARAAITPDGRYLVASATRDEWCGEPVQPCLSNAPAGIRIIELPSMKVVLRDEAVGDFALSADGRWVVGYSHWYEQPKEGEHVRYQGSGLQVFDLSQPRKAASLEPGLAVASVVFEPGGTRAVALATGPGLASEYNEGCPKPCFVLDSVVLTDSAGNSSPRVAAQRWLHTRAVEVFGVR